MENYVVKDGAKLKKGYTTGTCATAAATSAVYALLTAEKISMVKVLLPSGEEIQIPIEEISLENSIANCTIIKDAGDDPDVTHGAKICASVQLIETPEIIIDGGVGVGRVTSEGLKQKIGEAAINPVPLKMIKENVKRLTEKLGYKAGVKIIISVPDGEEIAKRTFNPRLGIVGGISILGTSGIVEPMSEKAIVDTTKLTVDKIAFKQTDEIILVFGNYGEKYCENVLGLDIKKSVQISNFVGESLDYITYKGFKKILLVGHTGKIIKLAGAIMDTHSKMADCRMEIISAHSALAGASKETITEIMNSLTTDKAFEIISKKPYYNEILKSLADKISFHVDYRLKGKTNFAFFAFGTEEKYNFKSNNYDDFYKER